MARDLPLPELEPIACDQRGRPRVWVTVLGGDTVLIVSSWGGLALARMEDIYPPHSDSDPLKAETKVKSTKSTKSKAET